MLNMSALPRDTAEIPRPFASGERLLEAALAHIESRSIREWATNSHNKPILIQIADGILQKNNNSYSDLKFATWMICQAMGF